MKEHVHPGLRPLCRVQYALTFVLSAQFLVCNLTDAATPVAAYNYDEGSGIAVTDFSGNANTGALSGPAWTTLGKYNGALNFDGISSWVTVNDANSLDLTTGMTLEAWVYPTVATGNWTTILLKEAPPGANLAYHLQTDPSNRPNSYITTDVGGLQGVTGPLPLALNTWTYLAATYNGATISLYVNGALVASQAVTGNIIPSTGPVRFGGNSIWGEYFAGTIDNVRIYDQALNQSDIQSDMNTSVGNCLRSSGYWTNHPEVWCMETIQIGCAAYTQSQAIAIMRRNTSQDKTYSLAQQLIAAKLNVSCRHSNSSCVASGMSAADNWLCVHPVGSNVKSNSSAWRAINPTYNALVDYNRGVFCAPSCTN